MLEVLVGRRLPIIGLDEADVGDYPARMGAIGTKIHLMNKICYFWRIVRQYVAGQGRAGGTTRDYWVLPGTTSTAS